MYKPTLFQISLSTRHCLNSTFKTTTGRTIYGYQLLLNELRWKGLRFSKPVNNLSELKIAHFSSVNCHSPQSPAYHWVTSLFCSLLFFLHLILKHPVSYSFFVISLRRSHIRAWCLNNQTHTMKLLKNHSPFLRSAFCVVSSLPTHPNLLSPCISEHSPALLGHWLEGWRSSSKLKMPRKVRVRRKGCRLNSLHRQWVSNHTHKQLHAG